MRISLETDAKAGIRYQTARNAAKKAKADYLQGPKLTEKRLDEFDRQIRQFEPERTTARRTFVIGKVEIPLPGKKVKL